LKNWIDISLQQLAKQVSRHIQTQQFNVK